MNKGSDNPTVPVFRGQDHRKRWPCCYEF